METFVANHVENSEQEKYTKMKAGQYFAMLMCHLSTHQLCSFLVPLIFILTVYDTI